MADKRRTTKTAGKAARTKPAKSTKPKAVSKPSSVKATSKEGKKKTTFTLQAPEAMQVFVAGSFNEWDPTANRLERGEEGVWTYTLLLEPGEHEYRFVVDDVWWDDPLNRMRRSTEFGCENCILIV